MVTFEGQCCLATPTLWGIQIRHAVIDWVPDRGVLVKIKGFDTPRLLSYTYSRVDFTSKSGSSISLQFRPDPYPCGYPKSFKRLR